MPVELVRYASPTSISGNGFVAKAFIWGPRWGLKYWIRYGTLHEGFDTLEVASRAWGLSAVVITELGIVWDVLCKAAT